MCLLLNDEKKASHDKSLRKAFWEKTTSNAKALKLGVGREAWRINKKARVPGVKVKGSTRQSQKGRKDPLPIT